MLKLQHLVDEPCLLFQLSLVLQITCSHVKGQLNTIHQGCVCVCVCVCVVSPSSELMVKYSSSLLECRAAILTDTAGCRNVI